MKRTLAIAMATLLFACSESSAPTAEGAAGQAAAGAPNVAGGGAGGTRNDANGGLGGGTPGVSAGAAGTGASGGGGSDETLSEKHPGDVGMAADPAVLFFDDFEAGWGKWDAPGADTEYLHWQEGDLAHAGRHYLRSTVTTAHLAENQYISASPRFEFAQRVPRIFWRLHVRFPVVAPNPHHWLRVAAGSEQYGSSGLANTVPPGNQGFWFDLDASIEDEFNFYVYWHQMRSGRCNDGTTTPGCAGDQGSDYHYGNTFRPRGQQGFARDAWFCVEMAAQVNTIGQSDGSLSLWVNDALVGRYGPGYPEGTWLRDQFHQGGCEFSACTAPSPFEGFQFRTDEAVLFKGVFLDAYYERDTSADKRAELEARGATVSDQQTILYDDIVVATERVGCRK
jgi:hypothetical protein